jgi:hypothetical protein
VELVGRNWLRRFASYAVNPVTLELSPKRRAIGSLPPSLPELDP